MQADYKGYLVMFGNTQLPNSFLTRYRSTPDQRIEKKAWRDNNESLQRVTSPNFKTTLNLELRPLSQRERICLILLRPMACRMLPKRSTE